MQQLPKNTLLQGGKYRIEKVLGQGGFGITYLATQELLDRKVCIKEFFFKEYCERDEATSHVSLGTQSNHELVERFMNKFLKEAHTISKLEHRNIIRIHDIFKENNTAYYVMDYVEGESLNEMVICKGALQEKEAVSYIEQVADALKYIHQHNINHLDIKPSNVMVRHGDYRVVLIDFGLSKQYDEQGSQTSTTPVGISHGYAPMEQYKQGGVSTFSPQTDIYSLGATFYKLVTGNTPPQASDVLNDGLPSMPLSLSSSVTETIKKAMEPRKVDRPKDVSEFLKLLNKESNQQSKIENKFISSPKSEETEVILPKQNSGIKKEQKDLNRKNEENKQKPTITILPSEKEEEKNNNYAWIWILLCLIAVIGWAIYYSKTEDDKYRQQQYEQSLQAEQKAEAERIKKETEIAKQEAEQKRILEEKAKNEAERKSLGMSEIVYGYLLEARNGNASNQYRLAWSYYKGDGVRRNYSEAVKWFRKSAEQGLADAQNYLGICYENGEGVTQNYTEAVKWYRRAAEQGDEYAQNNLGVCYYNGEGVVQNYTEAAKWYRKSAEQGNVYAQFNIGGCYYYGEGVTKDYSEAVKWYRKSAEQGYAAAQYRLGVYYYDYRNYETAIKWLKKAVAQNHTEAAYKLGYCYYEGYGVTQDFKKAEELWKKAAESNHTEAKYMVEFLYKSRLLTH